MPKKKPLKLPQVGSATPRRFSQELSEPASARHRHSLLPSLSGGDPAQDYPDDFLYGELSQADARFLSDSIDASISLQSGLGTARSVTSPSDSDEAVGGPGGGSPDGWAVQSPQEILRDVRRAVMEQWPFDPVEDMDDAILDRGKRRERELRGEGGIHIILPDNRVRAVEDQLGIRVCAELLGEDAVEPVAPPLPRRPNRPEDGRPKGPRRHRNPWYLPATHWYNPEAQKDPNAEHGGGFPYDSQILRGGEAEPPKEQEEERDSNSGGDGPVRALTRRDKETLQIIDAYKQYMKGHRLPHFLS